MCHTNSIRVGFFVLVVLNALSSAARLPSQAPALPSPDPGVFDIVDVSTVQELADACWNLQSNQAIVIAAGAYDLTNHVFPNGLDGRLTVGRYGAPLISNVQIRGATGNPADVVILGGGMDSTTVEYGFQVFTATDVLIADLSIGSVYNHAVAIQNDQGATRIHLYHCRLFDAGQQIVKASSGSNSGAEDVIIEYCDVFLTAGAIHHPGLGYCYTNGIDAYKGHRWIIRDNLVRNIYCQDDVMAGPAILMWAGVTDTIVERNTILNSSRGISLGLVSSADHSGGIVRNNFIRWNPSATYDVDVPIYTTSANSLILHNTVLINGMYSSAVEVRFGGSTGVEIRGNLMDGPVWDRDGTLPLEIDNIETASPAWFVDEAVGDLHLLPTAAAAVDSTTRVADCSDDFDGRLRPAAAGLADIGGDEFDGAIFCRRVRVG